MSRFPTIDISPLFGDNFEKKLNVAKQIDASCRDLGFFFISNHGIDCLNELFTRTQQVHFTLTDKEKDRLSIKAYNQDNKNLLVGYYKALKDKKAVESLYIQNPSFNAEHPLIKQNLPLHELNQWLNEIDHPGYREFITQYFWKMFKLSRILLRGFALAIGKNENFFDEFYNEHDTISSLRLIRYPYIENYPPVKTALDGTKLSFETHTDVSLLTVLYQPYVANLQVDSKDGYVDIESSSDCFLVNCGLFMEVITNGYYKSPLHRVKFINKERLSIPFFVHLGYHSKVPIFSPHEKENNTDKKDISYGEFFSNERLILIKKNGLT